MEAKKLIELKKLREKKGLTCHDMAKLLNISKSYYWQLENGKRNLYYNLAKQISQIFALKPDDIFFNDI